MVSHRGTFTELSEFFPTSRLRRWSTGLRWRGILSDKPINGLTIDATASGDAKN